jgi:hypothetical protein
MKKIPTLYVRDFTYPGKPRLTGVVTPGCEWVLAGEGVSTRKYDGTCVALRRDLDVVRAYTRREVKAGKPYPPYFHPVEHDEVTGKDVGWEPAEQSGYGKVIDIVLAIGQDWLPGTYELIGHKVNGNPEHVDEHRLVRHADAEVLPVDIRSFETLRIDLTALAREGVEGVVWHHADGRMAKLKGKDFL